MMTTTVVLPAGFTVRAPEPADAEGIFALTAAYNTAVTGSADCSLADIADCLVEPGFDRGTDGFLAVAADGRPIGYALAFGKGDLSMIGLEVTAPDPAVADRLYDLAMRRGLEMGRAGGHAEITVDSYVNQADDLSRTLLAGHGFMVGTTYHRMRIDHTGSVATPQTPADVVIRRGVSDDDASRWIAHQVLIDCFRGQFGFVPRPHDE